MESEERHGIQTLSFLSITKIRIIRPPIKHLQQGIDFAANLIFPFHLFLKLSQFVSSKNKVRGSKADYWQVREVKRKVVGRSWSPGLEWRWNKVTTSKVENVAEAVTSFRLAFQKVRDLNGKNEKCRAQLLILLSLSPLVADEISDDIRRRSAVNFFAFLLC